MNEVLSFLTSEQVLSLQALSRFQYNLGIGRSQVSWILAPFLCFTNSKTFDLFRYDKKMEHVEVIKSLNLHLFERKSIQVGVDLYTFGEFPFTVDIVYGIGRTKSPIPK